MARCIRDGHLYKRHKWNSNKICTHCGHKQLEKKRKEGRGCK